MLNAILFAALAALSLFVAILSRSRMLPRANLYLRVGPVAFGAFYWQLLIFLVCAFFGFAYFGIARLRPRPLNPTGGLVGFLLVALASLVWLISSFLTTDGSLRDSRLPILLFGAMGCFVLGVAVSTVSVAWGLLRR